ncbi:MAG TPA: AtpZ/AtpI family protein [Candidatus Limnocylindria bacterium]|nr:AtpZ/AtpI family protein [Candidatus Limnocylindria bacterium]
MSADPEGSADRGRGPRQTAPQGNVGLVLDIGIRLALSVVIGLGAGVLADGWLHTSPAFTLVGMLLGIAAAMYTIWEVAQQSMRR